MGDVLDEVIQAHRNEEKYGGQVYTDVDVLVAARATLNPLVTNEQRMQAVHDACTVAFDRAHAAWREGNNAARLFWITVQGACSDELQDCVAAAKAGVP